MNNCVIPQKIANDIFVRHENGGKTTIHSNKLGLKFLNETATMVFDLCTGYNTIEYICDESNGLQGATSGIKKQVV